jgi:DNA ligase-1
MLAETIEKANQDPTGWLMSEKLDGIRCFWNGEEMYSRGGKIFYPPKWFTDACPKNLALDGELWTKRNDFQNTCRIVKKHDRNDNWKNVTYMVYDAPLLEEKFKYRLEIMKQELKGTNKDII